VSVAVAGPTVAPASRIEPILPVLAEAAPSLSPPASETFEEMAETLGEIDQLAEKLRRAGAATHKITVLGTAGGEAITLTALTLARRLALQARVVVVDLEASSAAMQAASVDPVAPGIAELMKSEASFSQVITRDRLSRVHLVSAGRPGFDRSLLQSPRLSLAIDALLRVYDHVLLNAGLATDLSAELLTARARAIVVPDAMMEEDARRTMCEQLKAAGFSEVTMLGEPAQSSDPTDAVPTVVAA
jgi:polysaccharide biosynthesis transport protein